MDRKQQIELAVFLEFAVACPLSLRPETAENRPPREPDILCDLESGGQLAFELVSADDDTVDKARGTRLPVTTCFDETFQLQMALGNAYSAALKAGEITNPERFHFHNIHVHFDDYFAFKKNMRAVPDAIALLNKVQPGSNVLKEKGVRCIECDPYPITCSYDGPLFYANTSAYNVGITVVKRITDKCLNKDYLTSHPIHLLVWSDSRVAAEVDFWRTDLLSFVASEGMGQFEHLWVFSRHNASIVFDLARPELEWNPEKT